MEQVEARRLQELRSYRILDSDPEKQFIGSRGSCLPNRKRPSKRSAIRPWRNSCSVAT